MSREVRRVPSNWQHPRAVRFALTTPEELAKWLTDSGASIFGGMKATYEQWLGIARGRDVSIGATLDTSGGWSPTIVPA